MTIDPATSLANVELVVGDLDAQANFYRDAIGLRELRRADGVAELGAPDDDVALVTLIEDPDAPLRPRGTTGLFHLALLVPDRAELARALNRVTATGHRFTGASDHLVSEALYLNDPEGNGIEIYRDRPREDWPRAEGQLQMATLPLDLEGVLASAPAGDAGEGMAAGTTLGHVHLQVASIPAADAFYTDGIGFDATVRGYPGRAVRLGGRLPPPHRAQHLGRRRRARPAPRSAWASLVHHRFAGRGGAGGDVGGRGRCRHRGG